MSSPAHGPSVFSSSCDAAPRASAAGSLAASGMFRIVSLRSRPDLTVRRARTSDRERLLDIWERSVRATHDFLDEPDVVALRPLVALELESDLLQWWVLAGSSDDAIGFLGYANDTIEGLFIDPDHLRRGGGSTLVALAQHLSGAALSVDVNEANDDALRFYQAQGFVATGRSPLDAAGRPFPIVHMKRPREDDGT
jgi:putative acetyltransferase